MAATDLFLTELGSLKVVCLRPRPLQMLKFLGTIFWMLIFPKPFKVHASYLVWTYPRALCLFYKTMSLGLAPGWGQRSISRMMLMLKFLVKVFFLMLIFPKPFKLLASYLVWTYPRALGFAI